MSEVLGKLEVNVCWGSLVCGCAIIDYVSFYSSSVMDNVAHIAVMLLLVGAEKHPCAERPSKTTERWRCERWRCVMVEEGKQPRPCKLSRGGERVAARSLKFETSLSGSRPVL